MSVAYKQAYNDQVPAVNTTLYTCPSNTVAIIKKCSSTNDTTTTQTLTLHIVPYGESVGDEYLRANAKSIASRETYDFASEMNGHILEAGDFINGIAGGAGQLSTQISVVEIV